MNRSFRFLTSLAVCSASVTALTIQPAHANDFVGTYVASDGNTAGRGWWFDGTDTLCAKGFFGEQIQPWVRVRIDPVNGVGGSYSVTDNNTSDGARTCTGNLSIPEDKQYRMVITQNNRGNLYSKSVGTFYS